MAHGFSFLVRDRPTKKRGTQMRCSTAGLVVGISLALAAHAEGGAVIIESVDATKGLVVLRIANAPGPITVKLVGHALPLKLASQEGRGLAAHLPPGLADGSYRLRIEGLRDEPQEAAFTLGVIGPFIDEKH